MIFVKKNGEAVAGQGAAPPAAPRGQDADVELVLDDGPGAGGAGLFKREPLKAVDVEVLDSEDPVAGADFEAEAEAPAAPSLRAKFGKKAPQPDAAAAPTRRAGPSAGERLKNAFSRAPKAANAERVAPMQTDEKLSDVTIKAPKQKGPSLGERLRRKNAAKGKPEAAPGTMKQARPKRTRGRKGPFFVAVEAGEDNVLFYEVTSTTLRQVESDQVERTVPQAASFSRLDARFAVKSSMTYKTAEDLAMSEAVGDEVRLVHLAKQAGVFYATSSERVADSPALLGPGLWLVERYMKDVDALGKDTVVCLLLEDQSSPNSIVVLYHHMADGTFGNPQVTLNSNRLDFTLQEFCSARGIASDIEVLRIGNDELLSVADQLLLYPAESMYRGIPVRKLIWAAALVAGIGAVGCAGYAGYQVVMVQQAKAQLTSLTADAARADKKNQTLIEGSLNSFAHMQSLNVDDVWERAGAIWVPRTVLTAEATASRQDYTLFMQLTGGAIFQNRPSALNSIQNEEVQQLLKLEPPAGCQKNGPGLSGGVNVLQINVNCETAPGSAGRYRLD